VIQSRAARSRFYDGRIYAGVMDRFLSGLHDFVAAQIDPGQRLLDAGCGTGSLLFRLSPTASQAVGVELSPAMVEFADKQAARQGMENISFVLGDITHILVDRPDGDFDIATAVMVLHEMPAEVRVPVLLELTRVADRVLCLDFRASMPWNLAGLRNRIFELAAGREHFSAFRDFQRREGLFGIAETAGLKYRMIRRIDGATLDFCEISRG